MADMLGGVAGYASNILIVVVMIVAGIVIASFIGLVVFLILKWRRYNQFTCVIWERDGFGQLQQTTDRAGIFVDRKTKNKRLFLRKNNVGLNPDQIPYLRGSKKRTIYFIKTGLKNFRYVGIDIAFPKVHFTVGEEDVNWSVNAYERQKRLFQHSWLIQLLPFMAIAFVTIIILIIFIYFFREFGTLSAVAESLNNAAQAMAQAESGTTVIQ